MNISVNILRTVIVVSAEGNREPQSLFILKLLSSTMGTTEITFIFLNVFKRQLQAFIPNYFKLNKLLYSLKCFDGFDLMFFFMSGKQVKYYFASSH